MWLGPKYSLSQKPLVNKKAGISVLEPHELNSAKILEELEEHLSSRKEFSLANTLIINLLDPRQKIQLYHAQISYSH